MKRFWVFLLAAAMAFTACSAGGHEPPPKGRKWSLQP